ncbi:hypothetical protein [Acrocarpospora catenulata]|uniref:hypothetical protein n=1 Tax=Acrocarpospora catenulata TaxID=2836182 RepID=UPI001BD9AFD2|nr:hypothetical protein [Acrocarpospora catenulata]
MYADSTVTCTDSELIINRYYFPWGAAKRIPLPAIRAVIWLPLPNGSWRIWGSNDLVHWFNLDANRPRKRTALIIDTGRRILPAITPDHPGRLVAELTAHGIMTNSATGDGPTHSA